MDILEEMLKSEDCNESGKPIIKNEYSDIENHVIEETGMKCEPVEYVKCEELYIKDELESGEEGNASISAPEAADSNSSEGKKEERKKSSEKKRSSSKRKTQIKMSASKEEQLHLCPKCPFTSKWQGHMKRHQLTHSDNLDRQSTSDLRKFKCHYCNYKTSQKYSLNQHISLIHEREKATVYACQQCAYKTVQARNLQSHLRSHGEKAFPHKCPGCKKGFSEKRALDDHFLRKHDNLQHLIASRIYDCKFCTYKSTKQTNVRTHITLKHDQKNAEKFQCHNCNYFTLQKSNLIQHLVIHSNLSQHQCPSCERGFNRKRDLDSHIVYKHKDNAVLLNKITRKIHECASCNFKTVKKIVLAQHITAKHK